MSISSISSNAYASSGVSRQQAAQQRFQTADTDQSGGLSLEEFQAAGPKDANAANRPAGGPSAEDMFKSIDADSDGSVTQAEMESSFQRMHSKTRGALLSAQEEASGTTDSSSTTASAEAFGGAGGPPPGGPPPGGPPPGGPPPGGSESGSSEDSSTDVASLLSSSTDSTSSSSDEDDPIAQLISQLQTAIANYSQKNSSGTSSSTTAAVA